MSLAILSGVFLLAGCASSPHKAANFGARRFKVSLPAVKLMPFEFIQEVHVEVHRGRIVSVNRLLDDWNSDVTWDTPDLVTVSCQARHFVSGQADTKGFEQFITVESSGERPTITAKLRTSSCTLTQRPDRELVLGIEEMVPTPTLIPSK